jgi:N-methylhydantoinase A/oxoprolinase/acetone carboxylase beta subunit
MSTDGEEVRPFDPKVFRERLEAIIPSKPDAVTVSLLNSFSNPAQYVRRAQPTFK